MGNENSRIYEIFAKQILFEEGYYQPKNENFYYIEKNWYEQLCEYVNKKEIKKKVLTDLRSQNFTDIKDLKFKSIFHKFKEENILKSFNEKIIKKKLDNIEDNKKYDILDSSKYIKINEEFYLELIKYFKEKNRIKCEIKERNYRIIIYFETQKKCIEKFIRGEKELIDIKIIDYFKDYNYIILFSSEKEEIENYKKEYNDINLNNKIDALKFDDFYLILIISDENMNIKELFGTMGIANLGNNCFMNCCIQCLSNIFPLTKYFLFENYEDDINVNNLLGSEGKIVTSYVELLKILWTQKLDVKIIDNKKCYYFDQYEDDEKLNTFKNLKDEIAKNNILYNDYEQHDAFEFFLYFIDIIHEDLNRAKSKNNEVNILFDEPKDEKELYKIQYNNFKSKNNSIITDIFYGMIKTTICCLKCKKYFHMFEPYDILTLPLKKSPYIITNKQSISLIENNEKEKNNFNFLGKNNFYFCKCIIVPYDNNKEKIVIIYPIKKREYDKITINDIYSIIIYLFNLNIKDFVPAIVTENNYYYQYICTGNEYLYEIFKKPNNLKIYFVQINLRQKEINMIQEMNDEKKLFDLFQKCKNYNLEKESNIFNIGENIMGTFKSIYSNNTKIKNLNFVKLISMMKIGNNLKVINIPKIISYSEEDRIAIIYSQINNSFQLEKNKFNKLGDFDPNNLEILDDLDSYISQKQNLDIPFILFYKIERTYHNIKQSIYSTQEYYIQIPYCKFNLKEFSQIIKDNILNKDKFNSYSLRDYRIIIVWLKYNEKLKMIEKSFLIENMKEINPYEAMKKEIDSEKSIFNETDKINLNDLFNFYQASELYENSNSWFCENCNSNVRAIINKSLYSLPDVLIIHFQRKVNSIYNPIKIKFPIEGLNMSGYCYDNNSKKKLYDLVGIINFSGNSYTGHYNAFCKNDIHKKWFSFNDSMCSFIDNIEDEIKYDEVYILVYKNRYFQKVEFKEDKIE